MPIPYHRLARTPGHRWWRTLLGTVFVVVAWAVLGLGGYLVVTLAGYVAGRPENALGEPSFGPLADLAVGFLTVAVLLPVTLVAARWIQGRPAGTLSSVAGRLRWRWLLTCVPIAGVCIGLFLAGALLLPGGEAVEGEEVLAGWGPFLGSMLVLLLVVPLQSAAEEYLCRGWLLQAAGAWLRGPWIPIALQALVFAALHGWGTPWGFADLLVFGAVAGWLTVRTGGLEAAVALHVVNNVLSSAIAAAYGDLAVDETAADLPWELVALDVPILILYAVVVARLARRRTLVATATATATAPDPPGAAATHVPVSSGAAAGLVPAPRSGHVGGALPAGDPESGNVDDLVEAQPAVEHGGGPDTAGRPR